MENSKISAFIEEFLFAKEIEEGCASSTIKAYRYDLQKFFNIIGEIGVNSPFLRQKIRLFLKKLKEKNYSKKAIARKIATLRSFFKFLIVNELIIKNPMDRIQSPKIKTEENLPKFLDISDIKKIFTTLKDEKQFNSEKVQLQYLIVRLLYSTMARVSELCNIKIKDVDFEHGYIRLRGKGNKERIVPVDEKTLDFIKEYLQNRIFYNSDDFLLLNTRRQRLNPRVVQKDVQNIKKKCGFPDSKIITPHVFRHTGATHLRRSGMDISELQDILGHSSPNTTKIYAKNCPENLLESHNKMHPLNNKLKSV